MLSLTLDYGIPCEAWTVLAGHLLLYHLGPAAEQSHTLLLRPTEVRFPQTNTTHLGNYANLRVFCTAPSP